MFKFQSRVETVFHSVQSIVEPFLQRESDALKQVFPADFLMEIERLNAQKTEDAPVALVLRGISDFNGVLSNPASLHVLLQVAKTHRVALKIISSREQVNTEIQKSLEPNGKMAPTLFIFAMHGNNEEMECGENDFKSTDLNQEVVGKLPENARFVLFSCMTGNGLAQKLADRTNRSVIACMGELNPSYAIFDHSQEQAPQLVSYELQGRTSLTRTFSPQKNSEPLTLDEGKRKELFLEKYGFLKQCADRGNASTQTLVGNYFSWGVGVEESHKDAVGWYWRAGWEGHDVAQFNLGVCYENGFGVPRSVEQALYWYGRAAEQGYEDAGIAKQRLTDSCSIELLALSAGST